MHVGRNRLPGWALCLILVPGIVAGGPPTVEDFTRKLDYSNVRISPDGKRLSLTVALPDYPATRNLAIVPRGDPDGGYALTELDDVDITGHAWLSDKRIRIQGTYGDAFWNRRISAVFPTTLYLVDLRGAVGFGRDFQVGGWREQLATTQRDLQDVVAWLEEARLAQAGRVCVGGRLWGGHAALIALTESPDLFACGVIVSAPNDLVYQFKCAPRTRSEQWDRAVRDRRFDRPMADRKALRAMSPLHNVRELDSPVLLVHGNRSGFDLRGHYDRLLAQLMLHRREYSTLTVRYEDDVTPSPSNQTLYFRHVGNFVNRMIGGSARQAGTDPDKTSRDRYDPRYAESHRTH